MRFIVVGQDSKGRSCVVRDDPMQTGVFGELIHQSLWQTEVLPPMVDVSRRNSKDEALVFSPPNGSGFVRGIFPPAYVSPMHRTDTLDYGVIVEGSAVLVLEAGEVELRTGDCWLQPGLVHQWRAGSEGATITVVLLGLGPLANEG